MDNGYTVVFKFIQHQWDVDKNRILIYLITDRLSTCGKSFAMNNIRYHLFCSFIILLLQYSVIRNYRHAEVFNRIHYAPFELTYVQKRSLVWLKSISAVFIVNIYIYIYLLNLIERLVKYKYFSIKRYKGIHLLLYLLSYTIKNNGVQNFIVIDSFTSYILIVYFYM